MKRSIALILISAVTVLACACAKAPQANSRTIEETEKEVETEAAVQDGENEMKSVKAETEPAAETSPAPETMTEQESVPEVAAVEPPAVLAYKRNQNRGFFVEHDGKVYYRLPKPDAMAETALFGEYMSGFCGPSEIRCYDPLYEETETFRNSLGWGEFFVTGSSLVAREKDFPNDQEVNELALFDFNTAEGVIWGDFGTEIFAVTDDYVIYEESDWDNHEFTVYCYSMKDDSVNRLGKLEPFEETVYPGSMQQFYMEGNDAWFSMADYEGTGHFYYSGKIYHADVTKEDSLSAWEIADIEDLPSCSLPDDFAGLYNRAPGFVIQDGKPFLTEGEPATAEVDYATGELVYYDTNGRRIPVRNGYETFESEEEGTRVHIELAEFVDQKIYLVRNEEWRDPQNDVGWREAYVRKFTYVVMVDPLTGEETIIDFAQYPVE